MSVEFVAYYCSSDDRQSFSCSFFALMIIVEYVGYSEMRALHIGADCVLKFSINYVNERNVFVLTSYECLIAAFVISGRVVCYLV